MSQGHVPTYTNEIADSISEALITGTHDDLKEGDSINLTEAILGLTGQIASSAEKIGGSIEQVAWGLTALADSLDRFTQAYKTREGNR